MTSVVTFKTEFLSHCVSVLKALEQKNIGWLHELELLRRLGLERTQIFGLHQLLRPLLQQLKSEKSFIIGRDIPHAKPYIRYVKSGKSETFNKGFDSNGVITTKPAWFHFGATLDRGCDFQQQLAKDLKAISFEDIHLDNPINSFNNNEKYRRLVTKYVEIVATDIELDKLENFMNVRHLKRSHTRLLQLLHTKFEEYAYKSNVLTRGTSPTFTGTVFNISNNETDATTSAIPPADDFGFGNEYNSNDDNGDDDKDLYRPLDEITDETMCEILAAEREAYCTCLEFIEILKKKATKTICAKDIEDEKRITKYREDCLKEIECFKQKAYDHKRRILEKKQCACIPPRDMCLTCRRNILRITSRTKQSLRHTDPRYMSSSERITFLEDELNELKKEKKSKQNAAYKEMIRVGCTNLSDFHKK